ncbi:MAG: prepilin-type N-terminal cleavage/methylation domain-containing protein [Patescibacteria group bacterium]|nr:prepilin-type N-terminal cleavage/methylation domain-containing protein [Patescibacteria group bacterium]
MKILFLNRKNFKKNGFSLIEIIFAIGIITVGLVSVLSLFVYNIKIGINNKNKLIAIYLANESVEIVRQQRDNNWFTNKDWMSGIKKEDVVVCLIDNDDIRKGWQIKKDNTNRRKIFLDNNLFVQSKNSPHACSSWKETDFERYITITDGDGNSEDSIATGCFNSEDCIEITSHVSFKGEQIVEITTYLYNGWY